jgi:hypothetical protein
MTYFVRHAGLAVSNVRRVDDELGRVVAEVGIEVEVSGGPHPTLWKEVSSNF